MLGSLHPRWIVVTGGGLFLLLAAHAIWSVRKQYREQRRLSNPVVIEVWALYILHAALVGFAAWQSVWSIPVEPTWAAVGGIALLTLGLSILVISVWAFQSFRRMSGLRTDRLVTGGIYRWIRNPQNVGWLLALLGMALWGRSWGAFMLTALFALVVHLYITQVEEVYLERLYGDEYVEYQETTARYLDWPSDKERNKER